MDLEILQTGAGIVLFIAGAVYLFFKSGQAAVDLWATLKDVQAKVAALAPKTKTPADDVMAEVLRLIIELKEKIDTPKQ